MQALCLSFLIDASAFWTSLSNHLCARGDLGLRAHVSVEAFVMQSMKIWTAARKDEESSIRSPRVHLASIRREKALHHSFLLSSWKL